MSDFKQLLDTVAVTQETEVSSFPILIKFIDNDEEKWINKSKHLPLGRKFVVLKTSLWKNKKLAEKYHATK